MLKIFVNYVAVEPQTEGDKCAFNAICILGGNNGIKYGEEDPYELLEKENRISSKKRGYDG